MKHPGRQRGICVMKMKESPSEYQIYKINKRSYHTNSHDSITIHPVYTDGHWLSNF